MKKFFVVLAVMIIAATTVFANAANETKTTESAQRVVTTVCRASYPNETWYNEMNAAFEAETGIKVIVNPTPGNDEDHDAKVNVDLLAGSKIDVIPSLGPIHYTDRMEAGFFMPLNDICEEQGIDAAATWGGNIMYDEDGNFYGLPWKQELYVMFYNKTIFDEAGIAYPSGHMTWEEYTEIANQIKEKTGKYGSFMNIDCPWLIMEAFQNDVPMYKEDGTCNFDDPAFKASLEWFNEITNVTGAQPTAQFLNEDNASWNYYAIKGVDMAMFVQGNWFTRLLNNNVDYPVNNEWEYGMTQIPGNNNFSSTAWYSINKNCEHKAEAIEYCIWLAKNQWKYENQLPALTTLTEEEQNIAFGSVAANSNGQVTVADYYNAAVNNDLGVVCSDIIGTAALEYKLIIIEEASAYLQGLQTVDQCVAKVVSRTNEAIRNAQ